MNPNDTMFSCFYNYWDGKNLPNVIDLTYYIKCTVVGTIVVNGQSSTHYTFIWPNNFNSKIDYYVSVSGRLPVRWISTITSPISSIEQMDFFSWTIGTPPVSVYKVPPYINPSNCSVW